MSATSPNEVQVATGRSLLTEWANQQDHWLRAVISEILDCRTQLTEAQVNHFYELLLLEKGLTPGEFNVVGSLEDKDSGVDTEQSLSMAQIKDVLNVNALTSGQQLNFNPRLTVIFGENATGKSGYTRILKSLAAVRTAEQILSDVLKPKASPSASISYWLGAEAGDMSKAKTLTWNGEQGVAPLTRMDVFDSRGISIHVDGELSYVYTPADLSFFPLVAEAIELIKAKLEKAKLEMVQGGNTFLSQFERQGSLYSKIETLGASTDLEELKQLAAVSEEEETGLPDLENKVSALRADTTDAALQLANKEKHWWLSVRKAADVLIRFNVDSYNEAIEALIEARESYRNTSELAFAAESIPGFGSESCTAFIEAADAYRKSELT